MNSKSRKERFVVIGGCAAGMSAASKAKRLNPNLEVIALEKTAHVSYSACGIPYFVAERVRESAELIALTPEEFRTKRGIEVYTRHEVHAIDTAKRQVVAVELDSNREVRFDYDKLLLSVGGAARRPEIPGIDLGNIFALRTLQDGIDFKRFVDAERPQHLAIIGGGYIAMEMAEAGSVRGLAVTVIEKEAQILPGFEPDIAEKVAAELRRNRVQVLTSAQLGKLEGDSLGRVERLVLTQPPGKIAVDMVLVSIGLLPNTRLARQAGLRLGNTRAIAVDWKMQTGMANIFAAGDCTEVRNLVSGKPDYLPLGSTANKQGRVAGTNIGGGTATFRGVVGTSVFKTFDLEVAKTGLSTRQAAAAGFDVGSATITENSRAGYYSGVQPVTVTVIFEKRTGRLLGAQMVGREGVSKRIDTFAVALTNKMTLAEMANLDLSYAPPYAPVWDPVLVATNVARGKMK